MSKNNVIQVSMDQDAYEKYINGSGGEGGGSSIEYLDVSGYSDDSKQEFMSVAYLVKARIYDNKVVLPVYFLTILSSDSYVVEGVALDVNIEIFSLDLGNAPKKIKDIYPILNSIPRLTKEQFYSLETTTNTFTFSLNGSEETADNGMTWEQWVASDYNYGYYIENGNVLYNSGFGGIIQKIDGVTSSDKINVGGEYWLTDYSGGIGGLG